MPNEKTPLDKILAKHPIEPEEIIAWLQQPVTKVFMESVRVEQSVCDNEVHVSLGAGNINESLLANGGFRTYERILEIPRDIIDGLKERKKNESS